MSQFLNSRWSICFVLCWLLSTVSLHAAEREGFEDLKPGVVQEFKTPLGKWTSESGVVIIDPKHSKAGRQCLQLAGGEQTSLVLELEKPVSSPSQISFWAERWTARLPFRFRIEVESSKGWNEIYSGDQSVRVGRAFLNYVTIPLGKEPVKRLRFWVSSPPNTGVLIDEFQIAPARKQELVNVELQPVTLPALVGVNNSPLAFVNVKTAGRLQPLKLTGIKASLLGLNEIDQLSISLGKKSVDLPLASAVEGQKMYWEFDLIGLEEGENFISLSAHVKDGADLDRHIGTTMESLHFSDGSVVQLEQQQVTQRLGVAIRKAGDDDVHTYRIPGLATTTQGTLIGVYDVRYRGGHDLPADIDIGMSRSVDGGRTWEPMKIIMDMGDDPEWKYDGVGDPAILVDRNTGTIWVAGLWSHGNKGWHGSQEGLDSEVTGQIMLVRSDDDGVTWSKPINITSQVKRPEWCLFLQGPGKGITMEDETLVFAAQFQDSEENRRVPHSTIIYSKDNGATWQAGTGAFAETTEAQVVEIEPGVLMLNCRYNLKPSRVILTTKDMGQSWQQHPTSEQALIEPGACMASLIGVEQDLKNQSGNWLLFSNPDSLQGRQRITIKASADRGKTWSLKNQVLLDEHRSAGYSCMTMIDGQTVGILYEGSQAHLTFQRIPLAELMKSVVER